jgi:small subunit ribosomal protein S8
VFVKLVCDLQLLGGFLSGITDPIADMLTRVRNGLKAKHDSVLMPKSSLKVQITKVLKQEGYIRSFDFIESNGFPMLQINLSYDDNNVPLINGIKRISKPGLRIYVSKSNVPIVYSGLGTSIITTSQGVLTGKETWRRGLGGEVICHVW